MDVAETARMRIDLAAAGSLVAARDGQLDDYKQRVEQLRDQLVQRELALASTQQALRAADAEKHLLSAQVDRLSLASRTAAGQHSSEMQAEAFRRESELAAARREHEEQMSKLQSRLIDMAEELDATRELAHGLRSECARLAQQVDETERQAQQLAQEAEAAKAAVQGVQRALAEAKDERAKAVLLRDERLGELQAQLAALTRAGESRLVDQQAALAGWIERYNLLRQASDRQAAELDAAQRAERRAVSALLDAERKQQEAAGAAARQAEQVAALQAELRRQVAQSSATEMELRLLKRRQQQQQQQQPYAGQQGEYAQPELRGQLGGEPRRQRTDAAAGLSCSRSKAALRRFEAQRCGHAHQGASCSCCAPPCRPCGCAQATACTCHGPAPTTRATKSASTTPLKAAAAVAKGLLTPYKLV